MYISEALTMAEVTTITARANFSELVNRAAYAKERVVLTRHGKPVAVMVSLEDLEALERLEDEQDAQLAAAALKQWQADQRPSLPWSTVKGEGGR
jgi:prevent-host-death family protein